MIDIIIPLVNLDDNIYKTLSSISIQSIAINLKIYLINATSKQIDDIVDKFENLNIQIVSSNLKNKCKLYNLGIQNSKNNYLFFIDAGDQINSSLSLLKLRNEISKGYDFVGGYVIDNISSKYGYFERYIYGKLYNRQFINKNRIRFFEELDYDVNFNNLVLMSTSNYSYIDSISYIYFRHEVENEMEDLDNYFKNLCYVINYCEKNKISDDVICSYLYHELILLKFYINGDLDKIDNLKSNLKKYNFYKYLLLLDMEKKQDILEVS